MGLKIYVGLLLLTPKVLSLLFDPQDNAFFSWAISTLHSTIGLISGSVEHSPAHQLKAYQGVFLLIKERTFLNSAMTSNKPTMD